MTATFIGVRHHSPACARLVERTIEALRPAYVLVEGPAEMNGRLDELLLDHELPVAVFTSYRDADRQHASWAPFCGYSPEWIALTTGRSVGAELRFIDLPGWHPALAGRRNRYADAERRYADVVERLCATFGVDNIDALWDHLFEIEPDDRLAERLATYFDLVRGDLDAGEEDAEREAYMARWVRAAVAAAGQRPVVVVTGGFHRPALIRLTLSATNGATGDGWPAVPPRPDSATGGSYLVPYSFRRLDAFDGYQSGMPSPEYYRQLWEAGPEHAARYLMAAVVGRLRERRQPVSTASLIAARASAEGLSRVRGHQHPARTDVLDGLATALVGEALDVPLPWAGRGTLRTGTHPVVVEMVAALSGTRVGRLHPSTPTPPLVHEVAAELRRHGLDQPGRLRLTLGQDPDRTRSRTLHRLRVLGIPGFVRRTGPATGIDPVRVEEWTVRDDENRLPALIEVGGYGPTLIEATSAFLAERVVTAGGDVDQLAEVLFDAALAGAAKLSARVLIEVGRAIAAAPEIGAIGRMLTVMLALWRHDRLLGTARGDTLGVVIKAGVTRALWLAEGIRGGAEPADLPRIAALVAVRDAIVHATTEVDLDRDAALAVAGRLAVDPGVPPDLRGAAFGFCWSLSPDGMGDPVRAVRGAFEPSSVGDWLAGLFALAREEVLGQPGIIEVLDDRLGALDDRDFAVALPALRQAFEFFPPRERETIASRLFARRGVAGSGRSLLRLPVAVDLVAAGLELDARVDAALIREGLFTP
ncbi:hypothetical protein BDK92_1126 [Micromonospora pisi]|uniref:Uncharacterized protein n=1 Tax=Micromonospora pisi TaxID=589240 RepID=A0A495JEA8_9ACTN|nr:DUF5682 family protein [Micromonospora pisi]RKR86858.1 hypothetical protein BDK92_1126 [Micromonospora pisi]